MTLGVAGALPAELAHDHVLVVPEGTDLAEYARSRYLDAGWAREPVSTVQATAEMPRAVGARFRGSQVRAEARPGILTLDDELCAVGPFPLTPAQTQALDVEQGAIGYALHAAQPPARGGPAAAAEDRDGLVRAFGPAMPVGAELRALRWAVAVARAVRGSLVTSTNEVVTPDPRSSVDLTLYSAHALTAGQVLPMLRKVQPGARVVDESRVERGPAAFTLVGESPYDGDLHVWLQRATDVPLALQRRAWREYGPFEYRMMWRPAEPLELDVEHPSGTHLIARERVRSAIAGLSVALTARIGGTVVSDSGFVVGSDELRARAEMSRGGSVWV
ncbi:hypothetical protein GCM10025865_09270 [Paraoerskovia sediminicola]|uniref:Uncharacterized protein n=1 Tax=Paraoerskovia sediminicola TaxID=1138587 RepID=A0ABM8G0U9_9CELL|nr:hypothetical protein [Paraoerskovia sediminicola]BDZ41628.1 hypothetical protein GCM10025865_09270 [Paraoerskovia sediminicola]